MKNYEKYAEEIKNYEGTKFCIDFIIPNILKESDCCGSCVQCRLLQTMWLFEEYEEPEVDWSKVAVDTPILVRDYENDPWYKRYFAEYKDGLIWTYGQGTTSWSTAGELMMWRMGKLAEEGKAE